MRGRLIRGSPTGSEASVRGVPAMEILLHVKDRIPEGQVRSAPGLDSGTQSRTGCGTPLSAWITTRRCSFQKKLAGTVWANYRLLDAQWQVHHASPEVSGRRRRSWANPTSAPAPQPSNILPGASTHCAASVLEWDHCSAWFSS